MFSQICIAKYFGSKSIQSTPPPLPPSFNFSLAKTLIAIKREGGVYNMVIGEWERANPSRYKGSNFSIFYIFVVDLPSAHEQPHIPCTFHYHPVVCSCKLVGLFKNGNQRDPRTARGATGAS